MAFFDEGTPRWGSYEQGGTGVTAVTSETPEYRLVTASRAVGAKYDKVALTNAATDVIEGVTAGADDYASIDPYTTPPSNVKLTRIKTSQKLRVETATAYVAANKGKGINPDATSGNEGMAVVAATGGTGRIDGGETIGTKHYLDFWMNESSPR